VISATPSAEGFRCVAAKLTHAADGTLVEQRPSPNHGAVMAAPGPRFLVIHYTAGRSADSAAKWLCNPAAKASAHLVIGADGRVIQLVALDRVAWHAGASEWTRAGKVYGGLNHRSIGVELDNPGRLVRKGARWHSTALGTDYADDEVIVAAHKRETRECGWRVYPAVQLEVAELVARALIDAYGLVDVIGHDDVAPGRKSDPGPAFPMESFRARLFGRASDEVA
jgi:N-acetylmuramoyl-L-alanine amidase